MGKRGTAGESVLGEHGHPVEDGVHVDGRCGHRTPVDEGVKTREQLADPVRFVANQASQLAVGCIDRHIKQLRSPPDSGEGIANFVGQGFSEAGCRPGGAQLTDAMAADRLRNGAGMKREHDLQR